MEFAFTEDQLAFRDAVRDLLAKECPPAAVRAAWSNEHGRSGAAWDALARWACSARSVAEPDGGLGLTELDVVLLAEEAGYAALPEPFVEHVLVGAPLLATDHADVVTGATTVTAGDPLAPYADAAGFAVMLAPTAQIVRARRRGTQRVESVDRSRRLGRLVATEDAACADACGAVAGVLARHARLLGPTRRPRPPHARDDGRVRERPPSSSVRRSGRSRP